MLNTSVYMTVSMYMCVYIEFLPDAKDTSAQVYLTVNIISAFIVVRVHCCCVNAVTFQISLKFQLCFNNMTLATIQAEAKEQLSSLCSLILIKKNLKHDHIFENGQL